MSAFWILTLLSFLVLANSAGQIYRAATVEYDPYYDKLAKPIDILMENAKRYVQYTVKAAQQGAQLIAFPEFGLTSLEMMIDPQCRDAILPYFQDVPDPTGLSWNPCLQPDTYKNTQILHVLSCASRNNSIAILANLLSREECNNSSDPNCPSDNHYLFNTNIVFDRNGQLIARYHKNHLFLEPLLNPSVEPEYIIFEIDSIKFATFICFDIMYEEPAMKLVTEKGIKNIIFSTAWGNQLPFIMGTEVFSRWARGLGVNLIVSNYYKPLYGRLGAGIYSSQQGALNYTFDISDEHHLVIANLPVDPEPVPEELTECSSIKIFSETASATIIDNNSFLPFEMVDRPSSKLTTPINKIFYQSLKNFSAIYLDESEDETDLCHNQSCCHLKYRLFANGDSASYALFAYDGIHPLDGYQVGMQVCAVLRCETKEDIESCGRVPKTNSSALFERLSIKAHLDSEIVLPSVIKTDLQLLAGKDWNFKVKKCENGKSESRLELNNKNESILAASIYARMYNRDHIMQS